MTPVYEHGFRTGYEDRYVRPKGPTLPVGMRRIEQHRDLWLAAWAAGRTMAQRHRAELKHAIEKGNEHGVV